MPREHNDGRGGFIRKPEWSRTLVKFTKQCNRIYFSETDVHTNKDIAVFSWYSFWVNGENAFRVHFATLHSIRKSQTSECRPRQSNVLNHLDKKNKLLKREGHRNHLLQEGYKEQGETKLPTDISARRQRHRLTRTKRKIKGGRENFTAALQADTVGGMHCPYSKARRSRNTHREIWIFTTNEPRRNSAFCKALTDKVKFRRDGPREKEKEKVFCCVSTESMKHKNEMQGRREDKVLPARGKIERWSRICKEKKTN